MQKLVNKELKLQFALVRQRLVVFSFHAATLNFQRLQQQCRSNFVHTLIPNFFPFIATALSGLMITQITVVHSEPTVSRDQLLIFRRFTIAITRRWGCFEGKAGIIHIARDSVNQ